MMTLEEQRRQTLMTLLELAAADNPGSCFDDARAVSILRSQAKPQELRELGASESAIEHIFSESTGE